MSDIAEQAKKQLENSLAVSEVRDVKPYVAMYVPGGHGIMVDGPGNPVLNKLLADAARDGKVVSAVCHGPAAFVGANIDGKPIVRDKKVRISCVVCNLSKDINKVLL